MAARKKKSAVHDALIKDQEKNHQEALDAAQAALGDDKSIDAIVDHMLRDRLDIPEKSALPPIPIDDETLGGLKAQVDWVQRTGETPIELLVRVYRNPYTETKDRIAAAKAVLDYVNQKFPSKQEISDPDNAARIATDDTLKALLVERIQGLTRAVEMQKARSEKQAKQAQSQRPRAAV